MTVVGGREIHPINVRVGGFYRAPTHRELAALVEPLERAREIAVETVRLAATLPCPELELDHELVALRQEGEYAIERGRIVSSAGRDFTPQEFDDHVVEEHVERSNALHARLVDGTTYLAGPIARFNLGFDELTPLAKEAAAEAGLVPPARNPFRSIVVRSVELVHACDEALRLIASYEPPDPPFVDVVPRASVGYGATEAPRGLLWHRYELDGEGRSSTRGSSRPPPRTSARSSTTSAGSWSVTPISPTRSSGCAASRRSATTIPASRARRTSSSSRSSAAEPRPWHRQRLAGGRRGGTRGRAADSRARAGRSRDPRARGRAGLARRRLGRRRPRVRARCGQIGLAAWDGAPDRRLDRTDPRHALGRLHAHSASARRSSSRARLAGCRPGSSSTGSKPSASRPAPS